MIIEVNGTYHYNAPLGIKVGDEVELPRGGSVRRNTSSTWIGKVTHIPHPIELDYSGDIRAIVRKVETQRLTIEARSRGELRRKLRDALDGLDDSVAFNDNLLDG